MNEYSQKDSNQNRLVDEKHNQQFFIAFSLLVFIVVCFAMYYYEHVRPHIAEHVLPSVNAVAPLPKKDAPVETLYKKNTEAKPYDLSKPPYEQ